MRINRIFNVIVAITLCVATISCQKEDEGNVIDSVISVEGGRIITMSSAAADFEILYTVEGVHADECVQPSSDVEWLSFGESVPGKINVSLAENLTSGDRTAKLTLSLTNAKDVYLTVVQSANPDYKVDRTLSFDLEVAEIGSSSCFLTVNPNKQTSYYYQGVVTAEHYAGFDSDEDFIADYVKSLVNLAQASGRESIGSYLTKGYISYNLNGLTPDTDFYLVAFDLSLSAEYSGILTKYKFHTKPMAPSSIEFEISVDDNAMVTVKPKDGINGKYVLDVVSLAMWNRYGDPKLAAEDFIAWVNKSGDYNITQFLHEGEYSARYYNPSAETGNLTTGDYVAYVFGCDGARVTSGVAYLQFHFEEPVR